MAKGKIKTLYSNKEKTEPLFPKTKLNAISDENGVGLEAILQTTVHVGELAEVDSIAPHDADTLGGILAKDYATQTYVKEQVLKVQTGGEVDLGQYATKEDLENLSASDIGALPITGGQVTGALDVNGGVIMWKDSEGGNVRLNSPSGKTTDYWEMDSSDGDRFRIFAYRNGTHPNGAGFIMPLDIYSDGSIGVGNTSKTRENLGITPTNIGAMAATSKSLSNMSVKDWAASLTSSAWGYTSTSTTDMPAEVSAANNYAIATANVAASGGWIELRLRYVLSGCEAVAIYNYGWSEWMWETPPMLEGKEYRTAERYNGKAVYAKLVNFGNLPDSKEKMVAYRDNGSTGVVSMTAMLSDGCCINSGYNRDRSHATASGIYLDNTLYNIRIYTEYNCSSLTAYVLVKYTID